MFKVLAIILLSTVFGLAGEFLDLKKESPHSVLKREDKASFLSNETMAAIGLGNVWKLRPSRNDGLDHAIIDLFAKAIARHAYQDISPLDFNAFETIWESTQDAALREHFGCIHGIILASHLLKNPITYNDDDLRILSKLKNRFNEKARQKFLEWSYGSLDESEKRQKKFIFGKLKELLIAKELSREECLRELGQNDGFYEMTDEQLRDSHTVFVKSNRSIQQTVCAMSSLSKVDIKYFSRSAYFLCSLRALDTLRRIPSANLADVAIQTLRLITDKMDGDSVSILVGRIKDLPATQREDIVAQTLRLVRESMSSWDISLIMGKIQALPCADRTDVVTQTARLVRQEVNWLEISTLIDGVKALSAAEREGIITQTLRLVKEGMDCYNISMLVGEIKALPSADREVVVTQTARLVREGMNWHDISRCMNEIKDLPATEREDIVTQTLKLVADGMDRRDISRLIDQIKDIRQAQRSTRVDSAVNATATAQAEGRINNMADRMDIIHTVLTPPQPRFNANIDIDAWVRNLSSQCSVPASVHNQRHLTTAEHISLICRDKSF